MRNTAPENVISGVNDIGGQPVFDSPQRGTFLSRAVGRAALTPDGLEDYLPFNYYERLTSSLEKLALEKGLVTIQELQRLVEFLVAKDFHHD